VHLVGLTIEIYHDARFRVPEHQIWIIYFSSICAAAIPLLFYFVPDIIEIFTISWDDTFHFRFTEIRVIYHQPLCHKYFHLPIIFKFGFAAGNARYACAADNGSMREVPMFQLHNFLSNRPNFKFGTSGFHRDVC